MRIRLKRRKGEDGGSALWLFTFNDLMTNLTVFFVLVFSLSSGDMRKLKEFSGSFQAGLGVLLEGERLGVKVMQRSHEEDTGEAEGEGGADVSRETNIGPSELADKSGIGIVDTQAAARKSIEALKAFEGIKATQEEERTVIVLLDRVLFASGSADILPSSLPVFEKVLQALLARTDEIRVEGHTDNVPIHTRTFSSNWELSEARAVNVARYLIEKGGISPHRLCAVGYGEMRPVAPNDSPGNRQKNRRVELVLTPIQGE